jgi:hypothetical protein
MPEAFGEGHCKEIARRYRESATKTQELAAMHNNWRQRLSKSSRDEKKPNAGNRPDRGWP